MSVLKLLEGGLGFLRRSELDETKTTMTLTVNLLGEAYLLKRAVLLKQSADISRRGLERQVLDEQLVR